MRNLNPEELKEVYGGGGKGGCGPKYKPKHCPSKSKSHSKSRSHSKSKSCS